MRYLPVTLLLLLSCGLKAQLPEIPDSLRVGSFCVTEDERNCYLLLYTNWRYKSLYHSKKEAGIWSKPKPVPGMDSLYGAAVSPLEVTLLLSKWEDGKFPLYRSEATDSGWSPPIPLEISGNYPSFVSEYEVWLHRPHTPTGPHDMVRLHLSPDSAWLGNPLPPEINTQGNEFTAYRSPRGDFCLFTRMIEGIPEQQGLFISLSLSADGEKWSAGRKLPNLPYGWSPYVTQDGKWLWYTDGNKLHRSPWSGIFKK